MDWGREKDRIVTAERQVRELLCSSSSMVAWSRRESVKVLRCSESGAKGTKPVAGSNVGYQTQQSRTLQFWTGDIEYVNGRYNVGNPQCVDVIQTMGPVTLDSPKEGVFSSVQSLSRVQLFATP